MNAAEKYYLRAKTALSREDYEEGLEQLEYCLSNDQDFAPALVEYGILHMYRFENYEKALEYFDSALAADLENRKVWRYLIDCLVFLDEPAKISKAFKRCMEIKGLDKAPIFMSMAHHYEKCAQYEDALEMLEEAVHETFNDMNLKLIASSQTRVKFKQGLVNTANDQREEQLKLDAGLVDVIKEAQAELDAQETDNNTADPAQLKLDF